MESVLQTVVKSFKNNIEIEAVQQCQHSSMLYLKLRKKVVLLHEFSLKIFTLNSMFIITSVHILQYIRSTHYPLFIPQIQQFNNTICHLPLFYPLSVLLFQNVQFYIDRYHFSI